jgi:N-acetylmuramoyl-L-alanine amidase
MLYKGGDSMKKAFILLWTLAFIYFVWFTAGSFTYLKTAISYRWGSRGSTVIEIQTRLRNWGYYSGYVDGIYGYKTYIAVKDFQRKNGLYPDGITGPRTLAALGINASASSSTSAGTQNQYLLGRCITGEARGEPYIGQVAVGGVIINRTRDPRFPSTISGVIYQSGAFTAVSDGQINLPPAEACLKAAGDSLNGWDPSGGAIYYYNPAKTTNKWIWSRPVIKTIGNHVFCK